LDCGKNTAHGVTPMAVISTGLKMNERIKELALKSGGGLSCVAEPLEHPWKFSESELEKFAELIVQECDKYVAERWDICEPWMNPGDLLKHFGIEK
jgi:hypothetical protein